METNYTQDIPTTRRDSTDQEATSVSEVSISVAEGKSEKKVSKQ